MASVFQAVGGGDLIKWTTATIKQGQVLSNQQQ